MTTVQITLPDQLAQEAQRAGLLSSEFVEKWLRDQLKEQRVGQLFKAMDRMSAVDDPPPMSLRWLPKRLQPCGPKDAHVVTASAVGARYQRGRVCLVVGRRAETAA